MRRNLPTMASCRSPESAPGSTGIERFIGVYAVPTQNGALAAMAGFIEYRNRIFQIVGITPDLRRYGSAIEESIRSFESVTEQRVLTAQPDRLKRLYGPAR